MGGVPALGYRISKVALDTLAKHLLLIAVRLLGCQ
jgi:hypothetical protein